MRLLFVSVTVGDSGVTKVTEWQETRYGYDSGIQSGANTVRVDDGDLTTSKQYTMTTTVTAEPPGMTQKGPIVGCCLVAIYTMSVITHFQTPSTC